MIDKWACKYSYFFKELQRSGWTMKSDKTLEYVKDNFKAKYKQKRYPKKKDQKNPLPITELKKILLHVREMAKKNG